MYSERADADLTIEGRSQRSGGGVNLERVEVFRRSPTGRSELGFKSIPVKTYRRAGPGFGAA